MSGVSLASGVSAIDALNPETAESIIVAGGGTRMLDGSGAQITCPDNTTENTLLTTTIPGGSMGTNGIVRLRFWASLTGSANKVFRVRYGGSVVGTCTLTTSVLVQTEFYFQNRNSTSSQIGQTNSAQSYREQASGSFLSTAINSTIDQPLTLTVQKTTGTDQVVIETWSVEVVRPLT